jgi:hypothetical protein
VKKPRRKREYQSNSVGILLEPLEPRLLLSGSWAAGVDASPADSQANTPGGGIHETVTLHAVADISHSQMSQHHRLQLVGRIDLLANAPVMNAFSAGETIEAVDHGEATVDRTQELIFVDSGIQNYEQLVDDIMANADDDRSLEVIVLETDRDGVEQISRALADQQDLDAIHFLTHGSDGAVNLGTTLLTNDNLNTYSGDISGWQAALSPDADLLFYGCDLAGGQEGRLLLGNLGAMTHADVSASDDLTGSARMGGDWALEYSKGDIETRVFTSPETPQHWTGVLADFTVTTTADGVAGSLRDAIANANANAEADVINLPAGTYTLTSGELEITSQVTITGAGAGTTIIDGDFADRVFHLSNNAANLTLTDLTVQNGSINNKGGGIYVDHNLAVLTASRVVVTGNIADDGAGIFNDGTITLTDVVISNNGNTTTKEGGGIHNKEVAILERVDINGNHADKSDGKGGGIHNDNDASSLSLTDVTVNGNTAGEKGGGLHNQAQATIVNCTFALNDASDGGGIANIEETLSMTNSTVSGNTASSVGGGLYNQAQATIVNCTFTLNNANNGGASPTVAVR